MPNNHELDAKRCPLCGELNHCAMANKDENQPCWCSSETFPKSLLDTLPENTDQRACICQKCLQAYKTA